MQMSDEFNTNLEWGQKIEKRYRSTFLKKLKKNECKDICFISACKASLKHL